MLALLVPGDDRIAAAVEGMVVAGEDRWAAYPMLRSVLWSPMSERHTPDVQAIVLNELAWGRQDMPIRMPAVRELIASLDNLIRAGVTTVVGS
ncbi:MAG: hypothetical protein ACREOS_11370 [Candidatus Dormibacteraceae bacterium]